jgi:transcriptional regulator with XRE-family HTH domain
MNFPESLKEALQATHLSGNELAKLVGVTHTTVYRWASGESELLEKEVLEKLAVALPKPWGCRVAMAWLSDHCPSSCAYMLENADSMMNDGATKYKTPLDRAITDIQQACARNADLRELVFDLAKLAKGL